MEKLVSYIIPCYNSEETINNCLLSIFDQDTSSKLEVIIVDSSENRLTEEVVENFNNSNIKYYHSAVRLFAGQARNYGIGKSTGNFCALIDSDIILPKDWTRIMLKKYETLSANCSSKIIMSGTIKNASITKSYFRDSLLLILSSKYLASNKIEYRKYLPGCNLFFNRNLKNKIVFPGFQSGEDILMTKKVSKENVKLVLIGPNVVEHITTKNLHQYSIELGTSSYMISIRGDKFEKSLIPFKLILGSLYKLFKIIYNVVRYRSYGLPKLLFYLPGVIIASLFYHLGIFYGLIKSKNNI